MAHYIVYSEHAPEECETTFYESERVRPSQTVHVVAGHTFCSCPQGVHGGVTIVEAPDRASLDRYLAPLKTGTNRVQECTALAFPFPEAKARHA